MDLFVYGTLRSPALMAAVAGPGPLEPLQAKLAGYRVRGLLGNVVPHLSVDPGSVAEGMLWLGLTEAQVARLDLYEVAFGYRLAPVVVTVEGETREAQCYLPPDQGAPGPDAWSLADWEADHLAPALLAVAELFAHDPLPDGPTLRFMWPMIEARAWSRHRAVPAPATVRHTPQDGDVRVLRASPPHGNFFRMQSVDLVHRRFDETSSGVLTREIFVGVDAAIVLPYDPVRDKILLVEQFRVGPLLRMDPNPWTLEPIAGIVDARETPRQCALRETQEEAGLTLRTLERVTAFYPSPGNATDYYHAFVGLCDLPMEAPYAGGLSGESEDLRLHPMALQDAMALVDTGEINAGPLIMMLYWLDRHAARLRAMS